MRFFSIKKLNTQKEKGNEKKNTFEIIKFWDILFWHKQKKSTCNLIKKNFTDFQYRAYICCICFKIKEFFLKKTENMIEGDDIPTGLNGYKRRCPIGQNTFGVIITRKKSPEITP